MKANRTITREKAMTVLYQILLYKKNKINYTVEEVIDEVTESMEIEDRKKIDIEFFIKWMTLLDKNCYQNLINMT